PALRLEMGPPLTTVTVNDSLAHDGDFLAHFVSSGNAHIAATIADEGGIPRVRLVNTAVRPDSLTPGVDYQFVALADSRSATPRRVQLTYDTPVGLQSSSIVLTATDVNGHDTVFSLRSGVSVEATVDGRAIHDGSAIAPHAELAVRVEAPTPIDGDSLGLRLD